MKLAEKLLHRLIVESKETDKKEVERALKSLSRLKFKDVPNPALVSEFERIASMKDDDGAATYTWEEAVATAFDKHRYSKERTEVIIRETEDEYQKYKAEEAGELGNPRFWIEASPVLTMFSRWKDLNNRLDFTSYKDIPKRVNAFSFAVSALAEAITPKTSSWYSFIKEFETTLANIKHVLSKHY
jgi:hypothetical protein